jgi:hypothetical protein
MDINAAGGYDTRGESLSHRVHQRAEAVIEEGGDAARIIPVLSPAEEPFGAEGALGSRSQPPLPVDAFGRTFRLAYTKDNFAQ